jgi:hypothetical protein
MISLIEVQELIPVQFIYGVYKHKLKYQFQGYEKQQDPVIVDESFEFYFHLRLFWKG